MVDLTGGFAMSIKLRDRIKQKVFKVVEKFQERLIMTACIMPKTPRSGKDYQTYPQYNSILYLKRYRTPNLVRSSRAGSITVPVP